MLQSTLQTFLNHHGTHRSYWLAYSGGLDSRVLLHLCVELRKQKPFSLKAIHIHHGLSPQADHWLAHCQQVCEQEQVDFLHFAIDASPSAGDSLENHARQQRYEKLAAVLAPGDMLLTAHHQDDQAETVLLQLLRGAGLKGLSAMPEVKTVGSGLHGRPLLSFTRAELKAYATAQQLTWVEDELNRDPHYTRNYLRHDIMPLLKKRWPTVTAAIARVANHCAEAQQLLDSVAVLDIEQIKGTQPGTLSVRRLLELDPIRQKLILRFWIEAQGVLLPSTVKLQQILQDVLPARGDSSPCVTWGQVELRRYQDELYLLPTLPAHDKERVYVWNLTQPLSIPGIGELNAQPSKGSGLKAVSTVEVRFRQGGETYRLANGNHHDLKKFYQEQNIPPWQRDRLPLIYVQDELAAIPGYLIVEPFKAQSGEEGYVLIVR